MILIEASQRAATQPLSDSTVIVIVVVFIVFVGYIETLKQRVVAASGMCEVGCGRPYACDECLRCDERSCNAGCMSCRPRSEWDPLSQRINKLGERLGLNNYSKRNRP